MLAVRLGTFKPGPYPMPVIRRPSRRDRRYDARVLRQVGGIMTGNLKKSWHRLKKPSTGAQIIAAAFAALITAFALRLGLNNQRLPTGMPSEGSMTSSEGRPWGGRPKRRGRGSRQMRAAADVPARLPRRWS